MRTLSLALVSLLLVAGASSGLSLAPAPAARADAIATGYGAAVASLPTGAPGVAGVVRLALADAGYALAPQEATRSASLEGALLGLYDALRVDVDEREVARQAAEVDPALAVELAALVDAVADAHRASARVLSPEDRALVFGDLRTTMLLATFQDEKPEWGAMWDERAAALARIDTGAVALAATRLADAVGSARLASGAGCEAVLDLPFVQVKGACDDTYTATNAFQVDLGGNDVYLNNAGAGLVGALGAGLSWDVGDGDDVYSAYTGAQGSGLAAVGILLDEGGDDRYSVVQFGQGFATGGLGLLFDAGAGNDVYESPRDPVTIATKGAGLAGIGILVDEGGTDSYHQDGLDGFVYGAAGGHGWLIERGAGADSYVSNDLPVTLLNEYLGEFTGPVQVSAEVAGSAILVDEGGDDVYQCGAHVRQGCQGAGGAASLALLLDQAGSDQYRMGVSFSAELVPGVVIFPMGQGAGYGPSAPAGVGLLVDRAGDDRYVAEKWAQGYGTVGLGVLLDEGGADAYSVAGSDGATWVGGTGVGVDR